MMKVSYYSKIILKYNKPFEYHVLSGIDDVAIPGGNMHLCIDTETEEIQVAEPVVPVIAQVLYPKQGIIHIVPYYMFEEYLVKMGDRNPNAKLVFHNAPFDIRVLDLLGNKVLRERYLENFNILDTGVRFQLKTLADGTFTPQWSLKHVVKKLLNVDIDKDEDIRLTFKRDMLLTSTDNADHILYAALDVVHTFEAFLAMPEMATEESNIKGAIALDAISQRGICADRAHLLDQKEYYQDLIEPVKADLQVYGLYEIDKNKFQAGHKKLIQKFMKSYVKLYGVDLPKTEKSKAYQLGVTAGDIFKDKFKNKVPRLITAYNEYVHYNKMLSTYLKEDIIQKDGRVHCRYSNIMKTSRTSSNKPNLQNL